MAKKKGTRKDAVDPAARAWAFFLGPGRAPAVAGLAAAAVLGAAFCGWLWYGGPEHAGRNRVLPLENIEIVTPGPDWIAGDVASEALRSASLDGPLWLYDDELVERIAQAFTIHPWVAEVLRVEKLYPARVEVEVRFRQPAALVDTTSGLYAVDYSGVVLPGERLASGQDGALPTVVGVFAPPDGSAGTPWGDARVVGALTMLQSVAASRQELPRISVVEVKGSAAADARYELVCENGTRVVWGAAPGREPAGEPQPSEKIARWAAAGAASPIDLTRPLVAEPINAAAR